jgi:hypothetical protein
VVERGFSVHNGELVGAARWWCDLVSGHEPSVDDISDGVEGVGRVHGIAEGDRLANAVDAGPASGNMEGRLTGIMRSTVPGEVKLSALVGMMRWRSRGG